MPTGTAKPKIQAMQGTSQFEQRDCSATLLRKKQRKANAVYRKESFPSEEWDTKILAC